jgi:hypothetical protein
MYPCQLPSILLRNAFESGKFHTVHYKEVQESYLEMTPVLPFDMEAIGMALQQRSFGHS